MRLVPSTRLLFWVALLGVPAATLGVALPQTASVSFGILAGVLAVAAADALAGTRALDGIGIEFPPVVRLMKGRAGALELSVHNTGKKSRLLRLAVELPPELHPQEECTLVRLPEEVELSRFQTEVTPRRRGSYRVEWCHAEIKSPFGFWDVRRALPVTCEIRAYPNLASERKSMAALFLNRGQLGVHAQRQVGKGREFEKLREYLPGDSMDDVHWKATAKRGHPVTKVYQIERTQEVYVIIDASRLSARLAFTPVAQAAAVATAPASEPPGRAAMEEQEDHEDVPAEDAALVPVSTLERFITSALVLGAAAERQGDHFGLLTFSDRIHAFLRASNGQAHYSACRDAIFALEPQVVAPDYDELFTFIRMRLRRRALLVFLTALDDPVLSESFSRNVELIRRQHLVFVNMLRPPEAEPLFSRPDVETLDDVYTRLGGHLVWSSLRELEASLSSRGVRFALLDNERLSAQLVTQYLSVKARQAL